MLSSAEWNSKWILAVLIANTNQYIHWLDDDKRWEGVWRNYVGTENLVLLARVGRADGPRGRKMFVVSVGLNVEPSVNLPQPEPTRSLFDATDDVPRSPRDLVSSGAVTSTRNKQRKGDCSFTVSIPSEEDRILVNRLCEKAKEAGLLSTKVITPASISKRGCWSKP